MEPVRSYLEFGAIQGTKKTVYDTRYDQEAYEFFMVARYAKDIIGYKTGDVSLIHHIEDVEDNLKKYVALQVCAEHNKKPVFYEIGSSLMGVIDALEFLNQTLGALRVKNITYAGVDNSYMMNHLAVQMHEGYDVQVTLTPSPVRCDVFFAKGVSILYACSTEEELCDALRRSELAIFDYTFSTDASFQESIGTGKTVTFLSLARCKTLLADPNRELLLIPTTRVEHKNPKKVTYEVLYGKKPLIERYQQLLGSHRTRIPSVAR